MRLHLPSAALGVVSSIAVLWLAGMQMTGQSELLLSADAREFLRHVSMSDVSDGQGGLVRTATVSGLNVQIVNGTGFTADTNGAGNLILGYNQVACYDPIDRRGSHNLIVGDGHQWGTRAAAGVLFGKCNSLTFGESCVLGGSFNEVNDFGCVIVGGQYNTTTDVSPLASILGGQYNVANAPYSAVCGGMNCVAGGWHSVVGGGQGRSTGGQFNWVAGSLSESQ